MSTNTLHGLRIDGCIRCGRPAGATVTLLEMRNHLYICTDCRDAEEARGKRFEWVDGTKTGKGAVTSLLSPDSEPLSAIAAGEVDLFTALALPVTANREQIVESIERQTQYWTRQPNSPQKTEMIERLREWEELVGDDAALERYRAAHRPPGARRQAAGAPLSIGGRQVFTEEQFVDACEASQNGWADGERLLRSGALEQWTLYQVGSQPLAAEVARQQARTDISTFRTFNELLYRLVPSRPFRLYATDMWQAPAGVPSATTPMELADACDANWPTAERHLYDGAMLPWLAASQGIRDIEAYFGAVAAGYGGFGGDRGLGLELVLEHAVPDLPRPHLQVSFDGHEDSYTLPRWDREIPHRPVRVVVNNTTRGYMSIDMTLERVVRRFAADQEPEWASLSGTTTIRGRPGAGLPATASINLLQLERLERGRAYSRKLILAQRREFGGSLRTTAYPVQIKTMYFFQGLRGLLWRFGLRGGLLGAAWSAVLAFLIAVPLLLGRGRNAPTGGNWWLGQPPTKLSVNAIIQALATGVVRGDYLALRQLGTALPLVVAAALALVGLLVGYGKGHADFAVERNSTRFRWGGFWLGIAVGALFWNGGGGAVTGFIVFMVACIVAAIRARVERTLRKRSITLLQPDGRA